MRANEWARALEGDTFTRRANFTWVDARGDDLPNTGATRRSRKNGDLLKGRSQPSKCDQLNINSTPSGERRRNSQYFRYDDTNPLNFAYQWCRWESEYPCPEHERDQWAAFSPDGSRRPFGQRHADALLGAAHATGATVRRRKGTHAHVAFVPPHLGDGSARSSRRHR